MNPVQAKLDITLKSRVNNLPWRGQFSPELVEHFIETFCPNSRRVVDPFCGSGTVISESMRAGKSSAGFDVNPAAYVLSSFNYLLSLRASVRKSLIISAFEYVSKSVVSRDGFFQTDGEDTTTIRDFIGRSDDPFLKIFFSISALVGCGDSEDTSFWKLAKGTQTVGRILSSTNYLTTDVDIRWADARTELQTIESDAIISSPPYINVFNYHQNYRPIMEHLGWLPLSCAPAEVGSNRKHRQNRFLTVVQYCQDLGLCFRGASISLSAGGKLVLVVGRESKVEKTAFYNGELVKEIAKGVGLFILLSQHERSFTNRFGALIYEDIYVYERVEGVPCSVSSMTEEGRWIGISALNAAMVRAPINSRDLLQEAIYGGANVKPSPSVELAKPNTWPL